MAAPPNPQRRVFQGYGVLPKVFIAYPHNPDPYVQIDPTVDEETVRNYPGVPPEELQAHIYRQIEAHERAQLQKIQQHKQLVRDFATFLESSGVAVAYDELLRDVGSENIMKWCQEQIEDSDYVILVVTNSFKEFLENEVPPEDEQLFVGHFLYNFVHQHMKKLLPVFLNQAKDVELLPVALHMCKSYEIWTPFNVQVARNDELQSFYSLLTNQARTDPPPAMGPVQLPRKKRIGQRGSGSSMQTNSAMTSHHRQMYESLCRVQPQDLSERVLASISERKEISIYWKQLAGYLGVTEPEVEWCEGRGMGDTSEMCLQMLKVWKNKCLPQTVTVASLADVVFNRYRNVSVFENLYLIFYSH